MPFRELSKPIMVLHVDDDEWQLNMLRDLIHTFDSQIEIDSLNDPLEAVARLRVKQYDCLIVDFQMPNLNGIELAKEVRKENSIPIIIYTGQGSEEVAEEAFSVGINDYFRKETIPQHYQVIAKRIRNIVEKQRIEKVYSDVVKDAKDSIAILVDGKVVFVNDSLLSLVGAPESEVLGKDGFDMILGVDRKEAQGAVDSIIEGRESQLTFDLEMKRFNGSTLPVAISLSTIDFLGEKGVLCFIRDITERKTLENKITKSEVKYRTLVELAPDGIMTLSNGGDITWINEEFSRITGYSAEEVVGKKIWSIKTIRARDIPKFVGVFFDLLRGGSIPTIEFQWINKQGNMGWGEGRAKIVKMKDQMTEILLFIRDVTERRRLEADVKQFSTDVKVLEEEKNRTLQEAEELITEEALTHSIINELKGPLNTIVNAIYLMDTKPEKTRDMKNIILEAVEQASRLLSEVKERQVYRRLELEEIDIAAFIGILIPAVPISSGIDVQLSIEPQMLKIDKSRMGRAIIEILNAAIEEVPRGSLLCIQGHKEEEYEVIEIKSSGVSIPPTNHFQPSEVDEVGASNQLASSRLIIEEHGGVLETKRALGIGPKIVIKIPLPEKVDVSPKNRVKGRSGSEYRQS